MTTDELWVLIRQQAQQQATALEVQLNVSHAFNSGDNGGDNPHVIVQSDESLLGQLPAGAVPGLVGGTYRFRDAGSLQWSSARIIAASSEGMTGPPLQNARVTLTLDRPVSNRDGEDVAVCWPD